jgi:hypothetical protein
MLWTHGSAGVVQPTARVFGGGSGRVVSIDEAVEFASRLARPSAPEIGAAVQLDARWLPDAGRRMSRRQLLSDGRTVLHQVEIDDLGRITWIRISRVGTDGMPVGVRLPGSVAARVLDRAELASVP